MSAPPSSTVIDTGDTFRLKNVDEQVLKITLGKKKWMVEPGKTALVPFEVIRINWGDPRSRPGQFVKFSDSKESGYVNKREEEIMRLGVHYGTYASDVATLNDPEWPLGDPRHGVEPRVVPHKIKVQTEDGVEIIPACFDTSGEMVYQAVRDDSEDLNDAVAYREHLEKQFDEMREKLASLDGTTKPSDAEVDSPTGR